jgi:hypothetical protein
MSAIWSVSEAADDLYPTEQDERVVRIAMMKADTALKLEQARWEPWKMFLAAGTFAVGMLAAGAALFAGALAFVRWHYGMP